MQFLESMVIDLLNRDNIIFCFTFILDNKNMNRLVIIRRLFNSQGIGYRSGGEYLASFVPDLYPTARIIDIGYLTLLNKGISIKKASYTKIG